jgi:hypothetical protein
VNRLTLLGRADFIDERIGRDIFHSLAAAGAGFQMAGNRVRLGFGQFAHAESSQFLRRWVGHGVGHRSLLRVSQEDLPGRFNRARGAYE